MQRELYGDTACAPPDVGSGQADSSLKPYERSQRSVAKYMLILGGADLDKRSGTPEFGPIMLERYMTWVNKLAQAGALVHGYKLFDQTGTRLTVRGGQVMDGPFIESKEAVGGIFVVESSSLEAATDIARDCPVLDLQNGYVEVRPIER
jgi:hypothetical protein